MEELQCFERCYELIRSHYTWTYGHIFKQVCNEYQSVQDDVRLFTHVFLGLLVNDVMTQIYIPQYRLVDEPSGKPHYVYIVEVIEAGKLHKVERRYSAFHCLHRELRKHFTTPLFPPKRVRSCQRKVLERRRQCLEHYLQAMLRFGPSRTQVFAFLGIQRPNDELECVDDIAVEPAIEHQPVYTFKHDPYVEVEVCTSLPDVVTQGVLSGLYESWK